MARRPPADAVSRAQALLRRLAPLLIVAAGFVIVPLLVQRFSSGELRTEMLELEETPRPLPPIEIQDHAGEKLALDRFRGKFVLLNFWATWCAPCKAEMPSLNLLASHIPASDLVILPVSVDAAPIAQVHQYYAALKLDRLGLYADPSMAAMRMLAVVGIPTTLLIDREGREIARLVGPAQWDSPAIVEGLAKIVGR
jgi:thiol-disulfide isomerase/thioredoxin